MLLAAQPGLVTSVLQMVQRMATRHLLDRARLEAADGHGGALTLIQRFGSAANLNIHLHCLALDGVYRCSGCGMPRPGQAAAVSSPFSGPSSIVSVLTSTVAFCTGASSALNWCAFNS